MRKEKSSDEVLASFHSSSLVSAVPAVAVLVDAVGIVDARYGAVIIRQPVQFR